MNERTKDEQSKIARKGGKRSGEVRREKANIRKALETLLAKNMILADGRKMTGAELIALRQMEKAIAGDTRAFEVIRDSAGQKPVTETEAKVDFGLSKEDASLLEKVGARLASDD